MSPAVSADGWVDGYTRVKPAATAFAGTFLPWAPKRAVAHTTQGLSSNPAGVAAAHPNPPQLWVCPPSHPYAPREMVQVYPLTVSARALARVNEVQTNKMGSLQVEIEGYAEDAESWSEEDLDWLAEFVFAPLVSFGGCDARWAIQGDGDVRDAAGSGSITRMTVDTWERFNGLCAHQNVPTNDHWDAGGINLRYVSGRLLQAGAPLPRPLPRKDTMRYHHDARGRATLIDLNASGVVITRREQADGSLPAWQSLGPENSQPFPALTLDTDVSETDGRISIVIAGTKFLDTWICSESTPGGADWTQWVRLDDLLKFLHDSQTKK